MAEPIWQAIAAMRSASRTPLVKVVRRYGITPREVESTLGRLLEGVYVTRHDKEDRHG